MPNEIITTDEYWQLDTIRISAKGVGELDDYRVVTSVPKHEIVELTLRWDVGAEEPVRFLIAGVILLGVALIPVGQLIGAMFYDGEGLIIGKLFITCGFAMLGWWLLRLALKKRLVVVVKTTGKIRKLSFHGKTDVTAAQQFLQDASDRFGYDVQIDARHEAPTVRELMQTSQV
jgi:hypothetical protein